MDQKERIGWIQIHFKGKCIALRCCKDLFSFLDVLPVLTSTVFFSFTLLVDRGKREIVLERCKLPLSHLVICPEECLFMAVVGGVIVIAFFMYSLLKCIELRCCKDLFSLLDVLPVPVLPSVVFFSCILLVDRGKREIVLERCKLLFSHLMICLEECLFMDAVGDVIVIVFLMYSLLKRLISSAIPI